MIQKYLPPLIFACVFFVDLSQKAFSETTYLGTAGIGSSNYFIGAAGFYMLPVTFSDQIKVAPGVGTRGAYFHGLKRNYQTGGDKERESQGVEFLKINNTQHLALNAAVAIKGEYLPWGIFIGFNIDSFGWTFAPKKSTEGLELEGGGWNILRYAYNDIGTLHSETYVGKNLPKLNIGLRLGTTHSVTQYRISSDETSFQAKRFLNFSDTFFIGVSFY